MNHRNVFINNLILNTIFLTTEKYLKAFTAQDTLKQIGKQAV